MKVLLLAVGEPKSAHMAAAIEDYESRVRHYFNLETLEVKPRKIRPNADPQEIIEKESDALLSRVPEGLEIVALDGRGTPWTSEELAAYLSELGVLGKPGVAFMIGGPLGLSRHALEESSRVLSLSSFTLPHELARLVLVEQIYRSGTIQRGEPYHKG